MGAFKIPDLADRKAAALEARKRALDKLKSLPKPGDPEYEARQAELLARDERRRVSEEARAKAKAEKAAAEEAARLAEVERRRIEEEEALAAEIKRVEELEAQQKAARKARYEARKAAKRMKKAVH